MLPSVLAVVRRLVYTLVFLGSILLINDIVPLPYMDEPFHVGQAQAYCRGNWSHWDPMITTPPGLYVASNALLRPLIAVGLVDSGCSTVALRATVSAMFVASVAVIYMLLSQRAQQGPCALLIEAMVIAAFPLHYFFSFLYYTDVLSTTLVLLSIGLAHQHRHPVLSATVGALAVCVRQTNVVWVAFAAALQLLPLLPARPSLFRDPIRLLVNRPLTVLLRLLPHALVCLVFVFFVIANNGIVLGDRSAHQAVFHLPQLFYFALVSCAFLFPYTFTPKALFSLARSALRHPFVSVVAITVIAQAIRLWSFAHPYLLSDNRHVPFTLWRHLHLLHSPHLPVALAPVYTVALARLYSLLLAAPRSSHWLLLFAAATASVLIPAGLIEFRYFVIPYLLLRVSLVPSMRQLLVELLLYVFINSVMLYLFLCRPFVWSHDPTQSLQRIMW